MGSSQSEEHPGTQAESVLLRSGIEWWHNSRWRLEKHEKSTHELVTYHSENTPLDGMDNAICGEHIRTVRFETTDSGKPKGTPLVFLHGYGSGLGIYYSAFPVLLEHLENRDIYALDMPGCGNSSRPKWRLALGEKADVDECEDWFVSRIEAWRAKTRLEKFDLAGHSMGGYIATAYAEKYPQRVNKLVLISPCGVPSAPPPDAEREKNLPFFFKIARGAWASGWSPFNIANMGFGRRLLGSYTERRFHSFPWVDKPNLSEYLYQVWCGGEVSAGGNMHSTLFLPGAYAKRPLKHRLPNLQQKYIGFIYGETDWMDFRAAVGVKNECFQRGKGNAPEVEIVRITGGGHNMMVDNPIGYSEGLAYLCDENKTTVAADILEFGHEALQYGLEEVKAEEGEDSSQT